MYSRRFSTIFVHIPKTGGQSVEHVFLAQHGLTWKERGELLLRRKRPGESGPPRLAHLYAREYVELGFVSAKDFAASYKFAVVRNPYERAVSAYRFRKEGVRADEGLTFRHFTLMLDEWNEDRQIRPQSDFLFDEGGMPIVDTVLRFERLNDGFAQVSERIFGRPILLPHVNKSTSAVPSEASDPEVRQALYKFYERDFDLFKYPRFSSAET